MNIERIMASLEAKHPGESEYLQAVKEVLLSIEELARTRVVFVSMLLSTSPS